MEEEFVKVIHARWIDAQPRRGVKYCKTFVQCSNCNEPAYLGFNMKYCPNCGSRMNLDER